MKRMIGKRKLHLTQIKNLLFDIEAVVNSRPLTYIDANTDDFHPLTPAHFLTDIPNVFLPELDLSDSELIRKNLEVLTKLCAKLKQWFTKDYLVYLVHRHKQTTMRPIRLGEIVLVASEDKRRQFWPLARVVKLLPGHDSVVRVVKLRTACGSLLHPIQKLLSLIHI